MSIQVCMQPEIIAIIDALAADENTAAIRTVCRVLQDRQAHLDLDAQAEVDRKREKQRPAAAQRQRKRRERLRRGNAVGDLFELDNDQRYIDASIHAEACHAESHRDLPAPSKKESSSTLRVEDSFLKKERGTLCNEEWKPKPHHYHEAEGRGYSIKQVDEFAADMRRWSQANRHRSIAKKADWDANFSGWLQRQKPVLTVVQGGRPRIDPDGYTARFYRERGVDVNDAESVRKWRLSNAAG